MLMSSTAERSVRAHFAVAKLIISAFTYIKGNGSVSRHNEFALPVAEGVVPGMPARTPVIFFSSE